MLCLYLVSAQSECRIFGVLINSLSILILLLISLLRRLRDEIISESEEVDSDCDYSFDLISLLN
jgi:hypothetical protein